MKQSQIATINGILFNLGLFIAKLVVGLYSQSIAVLADAFNSLSDVLSSLGIFFSVKLSNKHPDKGHPFGYHRAEPLAAFVVAVLTAVLAFEVLMGAIQQFITPKDAVISVAAFIVLGITVLVKLFMAKYFTLVGTKVNSPAILATGVDSRNDLWVSIVAIIGITGTYFGYPWIEGIAAVLLSICLFYVSWKLGQKNVDYLLGKSASKVFEQQIRTLSLGVKQVVGVKHLRSHYVGNFIHVEVAIVVDKNMTVEASHVVGVKVRELIQHLPQVDRAFVHIDPSH